MAIQRMDHVSVVVDDIEAAMAFFVELGLELDGQATLEGRAVDRVAGLDDVQCDIAMMRTPDGHGRLELTKFRRPAALSAEPESAPANTLGLRSVMFAVDDIEDVPGRLRSHGAELVGRWRGSRTAICCATSAARSASSSPSPSRSAEPPSHSGTSEADQDQNRHI
jgi:catechol 2,3-dioxygenase-like lactoylglutathione lyase family enzyme